MKKHLTWILPTLFGVLLIGWWYLALHNGWTSEHVTPWPHEILQEIPKNWDTFSRAIGQTAFASIVGFLCSVTGGFLIAALLVANQEIKRTLFPFVLIIQMTPIIVIAPLIAIIMGQGLGPVTVVTFLIGFFPVVANTMAGLGSTNKNLLNLFKMGNATTAQELFELRIPYAMPNFLTGMKIAGTLAPIGALTGDFFLGDSINGGLGYLLLIFRQQADTAAIYALGLITCLLGFIFSAVVNLIHYLALHNWHDSYHNKDA